MKRPASSSSASLKPKEAKVDLPVVDTAHIRNLAQQAFNGDFTKVQQIVSNCSNADPAIAYVAVQCASKLFVKLLANGSFEKSELPEKHNDALLLREQRKLFISVQCLALSDDDLRLALMAFNTLFETLKVVSERNDEFQNHIYYEIINALLSFDMPIEIQTQLIDCLNRYDDLRYYFFKGCVKCLKEGSGRRLFEKEGNRSKKQSVAGWFTLISSLNLPSQSEDITFFVQRSAEKTKTSSVRDIISYKKHFSCCWLEFLTLPMNTATYSQVLENIHIKIIPFMTDPILLCDFFVDAYNCGGIISLLALNGLFTLIHEHNLDYKEFYEKLYALLDNNVMHVKYRSRFFRMVSLFLSSIHVPNYVVCAFLKRMLRLCLNAPTGAIMIVLPLVFNIFKLHPSSIVMIHRPSDCNDEVEDLFAPTASLNNCKALESSLWELELLQSHYHAPVSRLALGFTETLAKPAFNLEEYLDHSYKSLIDSELNGKKWKALKITDVPTNSSAELVRDLWVDDSLWVY